MKFNRKSLDAAVEALRSKNKNLTGSNADIFHANIGTEYAKFTEFCKVPRTDEEISVALEPVKQAITLFNDEMRVLRLEAMEDMKPKEAMQDYLRTQCVSGFKLTNNKELGYVVDQDKEVELDAYDFISTMCSAELNGILDTVCVFADNLARFATKDDEANISRKSMNATYIALRDRKGWNIPVAEMSYNKLAEQMTEVCRMISFGVAPAKMLNADVKYVQYACITGKSVANKAGQLQMRDEKTILRHVFRAIYTRHNNFAYEFQTATRSGSDKAPLTVEANKEMGENNKMTEFSPEKMPKAEPVTVGKAATKKSGTKKAEKK